MLSYSPELARLVRDGVETLGDAAAKVAAEKKMAQSAEQRIARLRKKAPDLAALVEEERQPLNEAEAALMERERARA